MSNKTIYPSSGGIVVTLFRSGTIAKGANVTVSADDTVITSVTASVQGIALDAGTEGIDVDKISVALQAHAVIEVSDIGSTAVGHYLKPDTDGTYCDDGTVKTADSVAFVVNATTKKIALI